MSNPDIQALVLAAGMGTRLRQIAGETPKVLVPIGGRPVIDHVLLWLEQYGIRHVACNLHYSAGAVRHHLSRVVPETLSLTFSYEPELLGTAGACVPLADGLADPFIVVYGDVVTDFDLATFVEWHTRRAFDLSMALSRVPNPTECGIVDVDEAGRVRRMVEKPAPEAVFSNLANAGVLIVAKSVLSTIIPPADFGRDIVPALLAKGGRVGGWPVPDAAIVIDMGTPAGLARARQWVNLAGGQRGE